MYVDTLENILIGIYFNDLFVLIFHLTQAIEYKIRSIQRNTYYVSFPKLLSVFTIQECLLEFRCQATEYKKHPRYPRYPRYPSIQASKIQDKKHPKKHVRLFSKTLECIHNPGVPSRVPFLLFTNLIIFFTKVWDEVITAFLIVSINLDRRSLLIFWNSSYMVDFLIIVKRYIIQKFRSFERIQHNRDSAGNKIYCMVTIQMFIFFSYIYSAQLHHAFWIFARNPSSVEELLAHSWKM